jgi:hypothetical protein
MTVLPLMMMLIISPPSGSPSARRMTDIWVLDHAIFLQREGNIFDELRLLWPTNQNMQLASSRNDGSIIIIIIISDGFRAVPKQNQLIFFLFLGVCIFPFHLFSLDSASHVP